MIQIIWAGPAFRPSIRGDQGE